jgi:hypothetical protein
MQCVSLRHCATELQLLWRSVMTHQRNSYGLLWQYAAFMALRNIQEKTKYVAALQLSVCRWCGRLTPQCNTAYDPVSAVGNTLAVSKLVRVLGTSWACGVWRVLLVRQRLRLPAIGFRTHYGAHLNRVWPASRIPLPHKQKMPHDSNAYAAAGISHCGSYTGNIARFTSTNAGAH